MARYLGWRLWWGWRAVENTLRDIGQIFGWFDLGSKSNPIGNTFNHKSLVPEMCLTLWRLNGVARTECPCQYASCPPEGLA